MERAIRTSSAAMTTMSSFSAANVEISVFAVSSCAFSVAVSDSISFKAKLVSALVRRTSRLSRISDSQYKRIYTITRVSWHCERLGWGESCPCERLRTRFCLLGSCKGLRQLSFRAFQLCSDLQLTLLLFLRLRRESCLCVSFLLRDCCRLQTNK